MSTLIVIDCRLEPHRLPQHGFLHGAELAEGRPRADVGHRDARFQPVAPRAHRMTKSIAIERGAQEQPAAPVLVREDELPVGRAEAWLDLSHANHTRQRLRRSGTTRQPHARGRCERSSAAASICVGEIGGRLRDRTRYSRATCGSTEHREECECVPTRRLREALRRSAEDRRLSAAMRRESPGAVMSQSSGTRLPIRGGRSR